MEINFTAEQITGLSVMMNNGTVPFMGLATILPHGVENVYKWKPSFMFDKVVKEAKEQLAQKGIKENYEFTNLIYTMIKAKYQISITKGENEKPIESIFLADNNTAGKMLFNSDGTYTMTDGYDPKTLVQEFGKKAKDGSYTVYLREHGDKPAKIGVEDIEEIFNLMHV